MFCTTSESVREVGPKLFITDGSKAVVVVWFSVASFWCQKFDDVSPDVCSYYF